jgi:replication fork clamp-binding protein CrfC
MAIDYQYLICKYENIIQYTDAQILACQDEMEPVMCEYDFLSALHKERSIDFTPDEKQLLEDELHELKGHLENLGEELKKLCTAKSFYTKVYGSLPKTTGKKHLYSVI